MEVPLVGTREFGVAGKQRLIPRTVEVVSG
jgi:hypothetical protein